MNAIDMDPRRTTHPRNFTDHAFLDPLIDAAGVLRVVEHLRGNDFEVVCDRGIIRATTAHGAMRALRLQVAALI